MLVAEWVDDNDDTDKDDGAAAYKAKAHTGKAYKGKAHKGNKGKDDVVRTSPEVKMRFTKATKNFPKSIMDFGKFLETDANGDHHAEKHLFSSMGTRTSSTLGGSTSRKNPNNVRLWFIIRGTKSVMDINYDVNSWTAQQSTMFGSVTGESMNPVSGVQTHYESDIGFCAGKFVLYRFFLFL